ncbi:DUF5110 domain-containing protein [Oxalobacteraceae bacterium]|nr:DUF5110 domain-containing protein [Oxalobacteraceae bacterium]
MTFPRLSILAASLAFSPALMAQNSHRVVQEVLRHAQHLEVRTNEGSYLIKPYSASIVETSFVPNGEQFDPRSHAVVLAPGQVATTLKDRKDSIEYATSGIVVTITKAPFGIAYSYKGKPLVAEKNGYSKTSGTDAGTEAPTGTETIDFALTANEALYGAGARAVGMNRRGNRFKLYNKAHYDYRDRSELMNYTMPLALSSRLYALHFDNPSVGALDFDSQHNNSLAYETTGGRKTYQVIAGDSWAEVVANYTSLTGRQPLPPRWAFGNFAMRFGYHSEEEARATVDKFIAEQIPVDAIVFDLYWFGKTIKGTMGNLAFDKDNFPNPAGMIADFKAKGVQTVLITEPFVLTTSSRWQEAVDKKVLGTDAAGAPLSYDFYFGNTGLVDVTGQPGRDWLWNIYKDLHQMGVAGVWGDLGEPEKHPADMHHVGGSADQVHNIFGHEWARLVHDGYRKDFPAERPFILMRAGYSGSQRFGMIPWSGDVSRNWGGLQSQPEIALQMGMQGAGYMHSDLGGFAGPNLDDELYARWLQYGVFQPIFRPHAQEEVPSEPVYREEQTKALAREAIRLRYSMLPYNYTLGFENNQQGLPLMRPVLFEEPGSAAAQVLSTTYLWGQDMLVSPVLKARLHKQPVYFPAHSNWFDFYTDQRHAGGKSKTIALVREHLPVFVRGGAFIPLAPVVQTTRDYSTRQLDLHYYHDSAVAKGSGKLYDDDGSTAQAYEQGKYELLNFASARKGRVLTISIATEVGKQYQRTERKVALLVHNVSGRPAGVKVDGKAVSFDWNAKAKLLTVQLAPNQSAATEAVITLAANDAK